VAIASTDGAGADGDRRKTVIVTGGATSVGLAIARRFLAGGYQVHIVDLNGEAVTAAVSEHKGLSGSLTDVSDPMAVERAVVEAREAFSGRIDVLVNNVGVAGARKPIEDIPYDEWDACLRANVSGAFFFIKNVTPDMKQARSGAIINISSGSVKTNPKNRADYNVSKGALEQLTASLAPELGPFGIRCNTVRPGMVNNKRMMTILHGLAEKSGQSVAALEAEFLTYISMRTKIEPSELAECCWYLASDGARHVTGQMISVCGNIEWES